MVTKKYLVILFSIILFTFIVSLTLSNIKMKEYTSVFEYFDSYQEVRIYSYNKKKANKALKYIDNLLKEYDLLTNRNIISGNNTYTINRSNEILEIDNKLYKLIEYGLELNTLSNGCININSGEFTNIFNKAKINKTKPNYKDIDIKKIELLSDNKINSLNTILDFNSIIKMYVGDLIKEYLEENGIRCYTINFLGSAIIGENKNSHFSVAIEKPYTNASEYIAVLSLNNKSVSSVGPYQNYYKLDNKIYHNLIDYDTKEMITNYESVTVVADTPKKANLLSYMLYFMEIEDGKKILKEYNADAIWYTLDKKIIYSDGMKSYLN